MCNITDKTKGNWFFAMRNLFNITIPVKVRKVLDCLHREGYEAFAVGGCVRDMILGCAPDDWDITTSAKPEEIKRIFPATIDTGIEHGTVTVRMDGESFEVTTYRLDGNYEDHRHPDRVEFTSSLREDLRRRDFTINAMAYNEREGLVDRFNGQGDLNDIIAKKDSVAEWEQAREYAEPFQGLQCLQDLFTATAIQQIRATPRRRP